MINMNMNAKTILEKIFGLECSFIPRDTSKKYIDTNKSDLYKVTCTGYVQKKDMDDGTLKNFAEVIVVNK